jgi:hypothetical protein
MRAQMKKSQAEAKSTMEYRYQVASDVNRDGLGVELIAADGNVVAEVFRCDADNSLTVTFYVEAVPFAHIEKLVGNGAEQSSRI